MAGVCLHSPVPALFLPHSTIQRFIATTIHKQTTTAEAVYATAYKERLKKERIKQVSESLGNNVHYACSRHNTHAQDTTRMLKPLSTDKAVSIVVDN